jgi:hypothetical protein
MFCPDNVRGNRVVTTGLVTNNGWRQSGKNATRG